MTPPRFACIDVQLILKASKTPLGARSLLATENCQKSDLTELFLICSGIETFPDVPFAIDALAPVYVEDFI